MDTKSYPIMFFANDSQKSHDARTLLEVNKIPFDELVEGVDYQIDPNDPILAPTVIGEYGQFMGIGAVRRYIRLLKSDPRQKGVDDEKKKTT